MLHPEECGVRGPLAKSAVIEQFQYALRFTAEFVVGVGEDIVRWMLKIGESAVDAVPSGRIAVCPGALQRGHRRVRS